MRFNKARLAALGLSAVMAIAMIPTGAFAESVDAPAQVEAPAEPVEEEKEAEAAAAETEAEAAEETEAAAVETEAPEETASPTEALPPHETPAAEKETEAEIETAEEGNEYEYSVIKQGDAVYGVKTYTASNGKKIEKKEKYVSDTENFIKLSDTPAQCGKEGLGVYEYYGTVYELVYPALEHVLTKAPVEIQVQKEDHFKDEPDPAAYDVYISGYMCSRPCCKNVFMTKDGEVIGQFGKDFTLEDAETTYKDDLTIRRVSTDHHEWVEVPGSYKAYDEWTVVDKNGNIVPGADGKPQLVDPTHGAFYYVDLQCTIGKEVKKNVIRELMPTSYKNGESYAVYDVETSNIKGYYYGSLPVVEGGYHFDVWDEETESWKIVTRTLPSNWKEENIVLLDCSKPGYYTLINTATQVVPRHYTEYDEDGVLIYEGCWYYDSNLYTDREGLSIYGEPIYDANGKEVGVKIDSWYGITAANKIEIAPHHVYTGRIKVELPKDSTLSVQYYTSKDKTTVTNDVEQAYDYIVTNTSCVKSATYTLKRECVGNCKPMDGLTWTTETITVPKNPKAHKLSDGYVEGGSLYEQEGFGKDHKGSGKNFTLEYDRKLKASIVTGIRVDGKWYGPTQKMYQDNIVKMLEDVTATCTEDGVGYARWYCTVCGELLEEIKVNVAALGHDIAETEENIVPATCVDDGSFDAVQTCLRCGKEISREKVVIKATGKHTYDEPYIAWGGESVVRKLYDYVYDYDHDTRFVNTEIFNPMLVEKCKVCGYVHTIDENADESSYKKISDQGFVCQPATREYSVLFNYGGKEFTGEKVVNYYPTYDQYSSRTAHTFEDYDEGYVAPTCTEEGGYTTVVRCKVCGTISSSVSNKVPALGHQFGEPELKVTKEATCVEAGVGSQVITCKVCGVEQVIKEEVEIPATGIHTPGEPEKENVVEATATKAGSYEEVVKCTVCGEEISRELIEVPATGDIKLGAVQNLKAETAGMNKVQLSWDALEGADGYLILKNGTQIAYTTSATSYLDKNANAENFDFYWVIPFVRFEGSNVKGELSNYVWGIGRVVGQVQKLTAAGADGAVELSWDAVDGANGYVVLSKTGSNKAAFNAPVEVSGTSCSVKAEAGKVQFYWVYAIYTNEDGNRVAAGKVSPFAWAIAE